MGSTGSIGTQTLDIVRQHRDRLQVVGLVANRSSALLMSQAQDFGVGRVALMDEASATEASLPGGMEAVCEVATLAEADTVVVAMAGVIGLVPTVAAIRAGKDIALASKEVLVAAGEVVMPMVAEHGVLLTPIDSEHSAVFQCLQGCRPGDVDEVWLTASGGPFRGKTRGELALVTAQEALNHPTWSMGGKITVDSATLMNKGLEVIEAAWLFGIDIDKVQVVVHPQSIVHSFVKMADSSVLAQCGWPDMRLPIQYALLYPERVPNGLKPWNPVESGELTFHRPDHETFPAIEIAREAARTGGTAPAAFNAANEHCANAFLAGLCGFLQITDTVKQVLEQHAPVPCTLESVTVADKWAREASQRLLESG